LPGWGKASLAACGVKPVDDEDGRAAVERWARQLESVGADVDAFSFAGLQQVDGKPVNDLNDSLLMDPTSFAQVEKMLP
jgi:hypothetical protein